MMRTECTVLGAALSRIEIVFHAMAEPPTSKYHTSLLYALDLSLVGCTLTLSILTKEMENLTNGTNGEKVVVKKNQEGQIRMERGCHERASAVVEGPKFSARAVGGSVEHFLNRQDLGNSRVGPADFQKGRRGCCLRTCCSS